jgi:glycosyltransferase involved in cell wall biosynthesis
LVVGDGDALDSVRAVTEDLGLSNHVRFVGYQTDIRPYLAAMDLFLFPSHKEAMGVALVEAMASGLASVATRVGGIPEVVTPDVGVLCPAHDVPGLAEAALSLLKDSSRRVEMGAKAKLRAEKVFSSEAMQLNTERVYRHVLQRGPQSRVAKPLSRV